MKANSVSRNETLAQPPLDGIPQNLQAVAGDLAAPGERVRSHHALRTALTAILGFSEIIERELLGPIGTSQYRDYARNIHDTGIHLLALADELLGTVPNAAPPCEAQTEKCDLGRVIEDAAALVSRAAGDADIAIATQIPQSLPFLRADQLVLQQVAVSLLSGAIRASAAGGLISAEAGLNAEGEMELAVHAQICSATALSGDGDVGAALSESESARIGLSVPQSLVELQGGRLDIEETADSGVALTLRFPASRVLCREA